MLRKLFIFDLDDTLIDTSDVYWSARSNFVQELAKRGLDPEEITEVFEEVDAANMRTMGFAPERYGTSMIGTAQRLLKRNSISVSEDLLAQIKHSGEMILTTWPKPIAGAKELLDWSAERFDLALVTRGDDDLQRKKLKQAGMTHYFRRIEVVPSKSCETFAHVMKGSGHSPEDVWVIGDSIRTDINPGIEAGASCILYEYHHHSYHWRQEHGDQAVGHFYRAKHLGQVPGIISRFGSHIQTLTI